MGRTGHMGRCTITSVIPFEVDDHKLLRVQGVALPAVLRMNYFAYNILEDRASKLNPGNFPAIGDMMNAPSEDVYTEFQ